MEGVSTRRVDDLVKALGCEGISKSQVKKDQTGTLQRISSTACSTRQCFLGTHFPQMSPRFTSSIKSAQPVFARPFAIRRRKDLLLRSPNMHRGRRPGLMANSGLQER